MKRIILTFTGLMFLVSLARGQTYLTPEEGYKVAYFLPEHTSIGAFDLIDSSLFLYMEDTLFQVDLISGELRNRYAGPTGYEVSHYISFLTLAPDGRSVWTGFTSDGNSDDRIYRMVLSTGQWKFVARFPGNFELLHWNDSLLVSGLNSTSWSDPNAIFVLDTSGSDRHRKIIEVGGSSAGLAIDSMGNLYYGSSFLEKPNALFRWDSSELASVIEEPVAEPLELSGGQKLTDLPAGASDCEIDKGGNLLITMNLIGNPKVLARWNRTLGKGMNLDTLAVANGEWDWLGSVKSMGDFTIPQMGNRILTCSFGQPLVDVHTVDYPPVIKEPLPSIMGYEQEVLDSMDLSVYVFDPDDMNAFEFRIKVLSETDVADLRISGNYLTGSLGNAGQSNLVIEASNAGSTISGKTVVGVYPEIYGDYLVSDFEDLSLEPDSYWNGADQSGGYQSGSTWFFTSYDPEWFSWSGWAYSSMKDPYTPGWFNQYSAISGQGFDKSQGYGVSYASPSSKVSFLDSKPHAVKGFMVTNSTYTALSMEHGDAFAKKFGGSEGTDPDLFKLSIWGYLDSLSTDTIDFHLADYRFEDPERDYIIKTWQWVDLSSLGSIDSLFFALSSSDMGEWGMNTPGYLCLDQLMVEPALVSNVLPPLKEENSLKVLLYPNPTRGDVVIETNSQNSVNLTISNLTGVTVYQDRAYQPGSTLSLRAYPRGSYILIIQDQHKTATRLIQLL